MGEQEFTADDFFRLLIADDLQCRAVYAESRRLFVSFLKDQQLDWKIGKDKKRTALFHKSLSLFCLTNFEAELRKNTLSPLAFLQEIGRSLYLKKHPEKTKNEAIGDLDLLGLPKLAKDGFIMDATELEWQLERMEALPREVLISLLVKHQTLEQVASANQLSTKAAKGLFLEGLGELEAFSNCLDTEIQSIKLRFEGGQNRLYSQEEEITQRLAPVIRGFQGLSVQAFEQKLKNWETIRKDEKRLNLLKNKANTTPVRELYWAYRKELALHLTSTVPCHIDEALALTAEAWSLLIKNIETGRIAAPLEAPLQEELNAIGNFLWHKGKNGSAIIAERLDLSPTLPSLPILDWEAKIKEEEATLAAIYAKDQRFISRLVQQLEAEFIQTIRKLFKVYDPAHQNRPSEIYYRSFAEVVYKIETRELTKPLTSSFKTYLIGVGSNVYRQEFFKQNETHTEINEEITENVAASSILEDKYRREANATKVEQLLARIGEPCKSLIDMRYLKSFAYSVIAERTGKKEGSLRTQLSRCMEKLRKLIL